MTTALFYFLRSFQRCSYRQVGEDSDQQHWHGTEGQAGEKFWNMEMFEFISGAKSETSILFECIWNSK